MTPPAPEKLILDACCGGRMFWFEREHPNVLYQDIRVEDHGCVPERPNFAVQPDVLVDFRAMPYPDKTFKHVVFDPPHLTSLGPQAYMAKKYGRLDRSTWREDLRKGFDECWRVLDDYGTLVFKWNEEDIPLRAVLACFSQKPLYGHPTAKSGKTKWVIFMKLPDEENKK